MADMDSHTVLQPSLLDKAGHEPVDVGHFGLVCSSYAQQPQDRSLDGHGRAALRKTHDCLRDARSALAAGADLLEVEVKFAHSCSCTLGYRSDCCGNIL